jgi:hypothetical protein
MTDGGWTGGIYSAEKGMFVFVNSKADRVYFVTGEKQRTMRQGSRW